jgi:hypothetical protein
VRRPYDLSRPCAKCGKLGHWKNECTALIVEENMFEELPHGEPPQQPYQEPDVEQFLVLMGHHISGPNDDRLSRECSGSESGSRGTGLSTLTRICVEKGMGVMDDGCTETIAGSQWLLGVEKKWGKLERVPCNRVFGFGGGEKSVCTFYVKFPIQLAPEVQGELHVYVVRGALPLLFAKKSLKALKVRMDYGQDSATGMHRGRRFALTLETGPTGHYLVSLRH